MCCHRWTHPLQGHGVLLPHGLLHDRVLQGENRDDDLGLFHSTDRFNNLVCFVVLACFFWVFFSLRNDGDASLACFAVTQLRAPMRTMPQASLGLLASLPEKLAAVRSARFELRAAIYFW